MAKDALKLVVIGGSAGSLEAILSILPKLVYNPSYSIVIVIHRKADNGSLLTEIISRITKVMVKEVEDKEPLLPKGIYLAPPDYHLLLEDEYTFSLDSSEKIHYSRPSIDVTFESVATVFGDRAFGVLLSGANADGAAGLCFMKKAGGFTIVQDPDSADVDFMPRQAINLSAPNKVLAVPDIAKCLNELLSVEA
jgi:two-component system chemotaxis response regulator CheB